jgi:quinoprotein dehydrogenase-associated probable ABC transporter substrate-binding protein
MPAAAYSDAEDKVLRVCADPNNLPLSHKNKQGYENKIAELLGKELGWKVEYAWFPQRMGFIRNTLRARDPETNRWKCDLVTGVSPDSDMTSNTKPYYRSTYALAYAKGKGLDSVKKAEDLAKLPPEKLKSLKIGVVARTPAVDWLLKNNLFEQAVPYQIQTGDPEQYQGQIVEKDVASGKLDAAIIWGPMAGYFAKKSSVPMEVIPIMSQGDVKMDYAIAMGTRRGEKEFKEQIEGALEKNQPEIKKILAEYGVPLVDETKQDQGAKATK